MKISFDEDLDPSTVRASGADFSISDYLVSDVNKDGDPKIVVTLDEAPPSGSVVTITLSSDNQITDEVGNTLDSQTKLTVSNE